MSQFISVVFPALEDLFKPSIPIETKIRNSLFPRIGVRSETSSGVFFDQTFQNTAKGQNANLECHSVRVAGVEQPKRTMKRFRLLASGSEELNCFYEKTATVGR